MTVTVPRPGGSRGTLPTADAPAPARRPAGTTHRAPALDGLRALAVLAVVAFHSGAPWAPGGLLGVDVFFVLSGYLITSLLLAEHVSTGRVSLGAFWARRARRLLPALLLLATAVLAVWLSFELPGGGSLRQDALATLGYVANWHQALAGQDYFSRSAAPSPLLHMWSLGVEEQFYLVWPLLVLGLLAISRHSTPSLTRRRVAALAGAGALASAIEMALLAGWGTGASRLYYGSDTHASALLVGAALAAFVPLGREPVAQPAVERRAGEGGWRRAGASVAAAVAFGVLAAAVMLVPGTAAGLYRGGFLAVAVAVAVLVAHVVRRPQSAAARLLALAPLAALGRASYGVYLWHWPAVLLIDHGRTGLSGPGLLATRVAASVTLGALSWVCVEQRVLRGRFGRRPRRVLVPAAAALASVVALVLVLPAPHSTSGQQLAALERAQDEVLPPLATTVPVTERRPRAVLVGDSVAVTLAEGLIPAARAQGLDVVSRAALGCGIANDGETSDGEHDIPPAAACAIWPRAWGAAIDQQHADLLAVLVGRWELTDRYLHGRWQHIGEPDLDAYLAQRLDAVVALGVQHHVKVAFLTAPCFEGGERPDGSLDIMGQRSRVDRWNQLLVEAVARHPGESSLNDLHGSLCPSGSYTASVDGVVVRWDDGIHITPEGGQLAARSLVPELIAEARPRAPRSVS